MAQCIAGGLYHAASDVCSVMFLLDEVACKVLPSGDRAVLKHLVKKGSVSIKTLQDGELLRFRPGEEGDIEFNLEKNPEDSFSFCLYLSHPSDPTMRCYIMPEDDTTDSGVMVLRSGKRNYQGCYVFGSSIMVKFIK